MTVDADTTPERGARRGRSPFELLRFTATPVPGALVVVEIEGRVAAASGRFSRRPVLVVEADAGADRPRLELAPSRATLDGDRWRATYAIPAESYDAARFALGLRGTLLDLPNPDEPGDADRLTLLSREANGLRRALEAAEADAIAAAGELGAAVSAARDEALAESAERIATLEREIAEARTAHATALADLKADHDRAATEAEERHAAALAEAEERLRTTLAETEAQAEAAERRVAEGQVATDEREERLRAEIAQAQARALAAEEGIAVLRAELAEERERAQALEEELAAANQRLDEPGRGALWASGPAEDDDEDATRVLPARSGAGATDDDVTRVLTPLDGGDDDTEPFTTRDERDAAGEPLLPLERGALPRRPARRGPGAYVAVVALVLFIVILLVLVLGALS